MSREPDEHIPGSGFGHDQYPFDDTPLAPASPDVLAELNSIIDGLPTSLGHVPFGDLASRLRTVAAQIAERERQASQLIEALDAECFEVFTDGSGYSQRVVLTALGRQRIAAFISARERHVAEAVRERMKQIALEYGEGGHHSNPAVQWNVAAAIFERIRDADLTPILKPEKSSG